VTSGYSAAPLPKKLGIKEGHAVAFIGSPEGFRSTLGVLPAGVRVKALARGPMDVILLFATRRADLEQGSPGSRGRSTPPAACGSRGRRSPPA
jgi:hypothetical protein